jgi:hypothetical protein
MCVAHGVTTVAFRATHFLASLPVCDADESHTAIKTSRYRGTEKRRCSIGVLSILVTVLKQLCPFSGYPLQEDSTSESKDASYLRYVCEMSNAGVLSATAAQDTAVGMYHRWTR